MINSIHDQFNFPAKCWRHTVATGSRYCCYAPVLHWFCIVIGSIVVQDSLKILFFCTLNHFVTRLPLMRTHEDLSSDMELLYGFVVIFYLVECPGIYEIDYFTSLFLEGTVYLKRRKMPKCLMLSDCMWPGSCSWQSTTCLRRNNGKHVVYFFKHYKPSKLSSME